jgi:hypothetical protein
MKQLWTLHIRTNQPSSLGADRTYTVTRHLTNQLSGGGGAMPFTAPKSWDYLSRALEQVGGDQFRIAMLKKELDDKKSASLPGCDLDEVQLRVIGFTDV